MLTIDWLHITYWICHILLVTKNTLVEFHIKTPNSGYWMAFRINVRCILWVYLVFVTLSNQVKYLILIFTLVNDDNITKKLGKREIRQSYSKYYRISIYLSFREHTLKNRIRTACISTHICFTTYISCGQMWW